jgi:hypothetical protein
MKMRRKIGSGLYWLMLGFGFATMLSACGLIGRDETPVAVVPGQVTVDTLTVVPSGAAPVQVQATIGGLINDNCTSVVGIDAQRQDNVFTLTPQTVVNDTGACTPAQFNYSQTVSLDVLNLPAGLYAVNAGTQTGNFNLAVNNVAAVPDVGVAPTDPPADAGGDTQTETQTPSNQANQATNGLFSLTNIYFIALEDGGQNGPDAGCNDSVVPVVINLDPATPAVMTAAYNRLLSTKEQTVNNYFNPLFQSDLTLQRINIVNSEALVYLSGTWSPPEGDCIEAQMRTQLRYTALQYSTVNRVTIWLNGALLDPSGLG